MFNQAIIAIWVKNRELSILAESDAAASSIPLPESVVSNIEIVNRDQLYGLVQAWVKEHTYRTAQIVWILDNEVYFEKILTDNKQDWDLETVQFLDSVPFETIASRVYDQATGSRIIVATNKDLLMGLVHAFAILGYPSACEIPVRLLIDIDPTQGLTKQALKYVDTHLDELQKSRLLIEEDAKIENTPKTSPNKSQSKSSLPLLLGIFGFLVLVLIILLAAR